VPKPSANQGAAKVDRTHSPHERGGHFRARECNGAPCHLQGLPAPWIVTALCLLVVLVGSASAVRLSPQADRDFEKGLSAYQEEDLSAARKHFTTIVDAPENQRTSAALLMLTRTLLRAEQFRAGLDAAKRLEREFPRSRYSSDVQLLIGDCYLGLQRRYEAAVYYARLLDNESAAVELRASAAERLVVVFRNHLISRDAQGRIEQQVTDGLLEEALLFGEGRWFVRLGWGPQGREQLGEYLRTYKEGTFAHLARNRLAALGGITVPAPADMEPPASSPDSPWRTSPSRPGVPRIGVLLPLTGQSESDAATASVGREILDGIRYANEAAGEPFDLVVEDTGARFVDFEGEILPVRQSEGSRLIRVHNGARRLVEEGVEAIIGPIYSTSCVVAAAVAEAAGVPLLAPLAQQSGLDSLGSHVFQLNPIAEVQGQALAEYATLVLGLETLAILSPLSDYGAAFERSFTRAATLNGGRIVMSDQYFPQETTDFHRQFESLRQVGFELQPALERIDSLATLDSLAVSLLDTTLEGEWTFIEVVEGVVDEEPPDSSEVFLQTIDGVAVIVEHFDDAKTIAPQLHFHRLETQMLGNDVWYDPESIHAMGATERGHLAGAIFVARRQGGVAEQEFLNDYRSQRQRDPGYAADGYDAAQMLIDGWRAGHGSRRQLREWLQQVREYHGASGRVAFTDDRRVNSALQLLRIGADGSAGGLDENELPEIATAGPAADLPAADLPEDDAPWESMPLEEDVESSY
jgi:ABC-type branched-subunit amino acid transport system substrate-binding protein